MYIKKYDFFLKLQIKFKPASLSIILNFCSHLPYVPFTPVRSLFITGRNEVLAKVIFSQASVCPQGGGGWVSQHALQVSPGEGGYPSMPCRSVSGGVSNFWGVSNFLGGVSNFGGLQFFWGGSLILGGGRDTVNVRPVRILLECILVSQYFCVLFSFVTGNKYIKRGLILKERDI